MASPLVSVRELSALLEAGPASVTLLDVRYQTGAPSGRPAFEAGHLPGAAYVDLDADLAGPSQPDGTGGRHPLPTRAAFQAAMRRVGVRADRPVVVYDDWGGRAAARAWWLLRHHGHRDVRVLDGGWSAWRAAGGTSAEGESRTAPGEFVARPGEMTVLAAGSVPDAEVLVDARAHERYSGEHEPLDPVAGHIPGAVNVPTSDNLTDDGRFRGAGDLQRTYAAVGAAAGADIAVYCGSGVTACHDLLALEIAGVPAALYAGSWSDWVSDRSRPVATG